MADVLPPVGAYLNSRYARSLAEFGEPSLLPRSGASYLIRPIGDTGRFDAMGCYPYLVCADWRALAADLAELGDSLVSFAAAPEPFGDFAIADLETAFPDRVIRFKDHYVADLELPVEKIVSKHHRKEADKALAQLSVEFSDAPIGLIDEWAELFAGTARRFGLSGIRAYSRSAFEQQFALPGVVLSVCRHQGTAVAAHLWFQQGDVAYAHLAVGSDAGRALGADYALYLSDIEFLSARAKWIDWGGAVGAAPGQDGGLDRFKRGWSTGVRAAYFCGRVMNAGQYSTLAAAIEGSSSYFPAYRAGEFK